MAPQRTCIGCRRVAPVAGLVRVVRLADGRLGVGRGCPGRGAWLCAQSPECLDRAARRQAFTRALRAPVTPEAVDQLRQHLRGGVEEKGGGPKVCEDGGPGRAAAARPGEEEGS